MENTKISTYDLTKIAIMAAIIFVATYTIKIPSLNGYTHIGDSMIFIGVLILGKRKGAFAAGVGAALADLLGGYFVWIIPTFIIKFLMAYITGLFSESLHEKKYFWTIGAALGGVLQIILYTLVKIPLFGLAYAITRLPGITIQTITSFIISLLIFIFLNNTNILSKLKEA